MGYKITLYASKSETLSKIDLIYSIYKCLLSAINILNDAPNLKPP